jgi:hypothetical protein
MSNHMPPVPPANRSNKGVSNESKDMQDTSHKKTQADNTAEQGDTANIIQNTTN